MAREIRFWGRTKPNPDYWFLSNFYPCGQILIEGKTYRTSEHYYMCQKTLDEEERERIRRLPTARAAKQAGRKVDLRPDWEDIKYEVMKTALRAKFKQIPHLTEKLRATGDAVLIEDSPYDYIWGCGADGTGQNLLGKALMEIRAELM